jgi:hypothetical protein
MLRVRQVEVMTVAVPFRITFRHALASRSEGEAIGVHGLGVVVDEARLARLVTDRSTIGVG